MTPASGPPPGGAPGTVDGGMAKDARLALKTVRVGGALADLYVYDEQIVITTGAGERVIPMGWLERVASRRTWRGRPRILLALSTDEIVEVRGLDRSAASVAHRTIVGIARDFH